MGGRANVWGRCTSKVVHLPAWKRHRGQASTGPRLAARALLLARALRQAPAFEADLGLALGGARVAVHLAVLRHKQAHGWRGGGSRDGRQGPGISGMGGEACRGVPGQAACRTRRRTLPQAGLKMSGQAHALASSHDSLHALPLPRHVKRFFSRAQRCGGRATVATTVRLRGGAGAAASASASMPGTGRACRQLWARDGPAGAPAGTRCCRRSPTWRRRPSWRAWRSRTGSRAGWRPRSPPRSPRACRR